MHIKIQLKGIKACPNNEHIVIYLISAVYQLYMVLNLSLC